MTEPTEGSSTTDVRRLFGAGSVYTIATAAPMLSGLLVTPLLTRSLGLIEYDQVSLAIVVMNFTIGLLAFGLPVAITRHALVEESGEPGARGIVLLGSSLSLLLGLVVGGALLAGGLIDVALAVIVGSVGGGVAMTQAYALARSDAWFYVALATGLSLAAPALGLTAVVLISPTSTMYYVAILVVYVIVAVLGYLRLILQGPIEVRANRLLGAMRIGLPIVPHQIAIGSATGVAVVVAQLQLPVGSSAQTQLALLLATAPLSIISALSYAWTPIVLQAPEGLQGERLEATADRVAWLAALGASALAMLAPWALAVLAPRGEYRILEVVPLVGIACAAVPVAAGFLAYSQLVIAKGTTGPLAVLSPVALAAGAAVGYVLAPLVGLAALGIGFVSTYVLFLVLTRSLARRVSTVRWKEWRMFVPISAGVVACLVACGLPAAGAPSAVRVVLAALLLLLAVVLFVRGLRRPRDV